MEEQQIRLDTTEKILKKQNKKNLGAFIKGPIQLLWITKACALSKSAIKVALAICFLGGIHGDKWFKLESSATKRFSLTKQSKSTGLKELKQVGLIQLKQNPGSLPLIKIIDQVEEKKNIY